MTIDNTFIQHYEPLLRRLARRYHTTFLTEDDLVQEAYLALLELPEPAIGLRPGHSQEPSTSCEHEIPSEALSGSKSLFPSPLQGEPEGAILSYARKAMQEAIAYYERPVRMPLHPVSDAPSRVSVDDAYMPLADPEESIEDRLDRETKMDWVENAALDLPDAQREVVMRVLHGDTYLEIARSMGRSLCSVYNLYDHGTKKIKKKLLRVRNF